MEKLSPHFFLSELTRSQTAERERIDNTPPPAVVEALRAWCLAIGEPLRAKVGRPIVPSSGYRSPELNLIVSKTRNGQHPRGEAVDFEVPGMDNKVLAQTIVDLKLPFDQLILEYYKPGKPASGWVHVSYRADGKNRGEVLHTIEDPTNPDPKKRLRYGTGLG